MTDDDLEFIAPDFDDDDIELGPSPDADGSDSAIQEGRPRRTSLVFGDLSGMLKLHSLWVESDGALGKRAELKEGFLYQAKLAKAVLSQADVEEAYLSEADLSGANLEEANLAGANLERANLAGANLRGANLSGTDLRGADLSGAVLLHTNLQDANLSEAQAVTEEQLGGANLAGAALPRGITGLAGLKVVTEMWKNARLYFLTTLAASAYTWLIFSTMTDANLITKAAALRLPVIGIEIPTIIFYWAAPLLLLAFLVEFHRYTPRVYRGLARLPAVFPDARRLDEVFAPWPLAGLIRSHAAWLPEERASWSRRIRSTIEVMLGWWVVPLTIYLFWVRFVPRHDLLGTALHVIIIAVSVGFGFASFRGATDTLRGEKETGFFSLPRAVAGVGFVGVVLLSVAAFLGWNPVTETGGSPLQSGLRVIGYRAYADLAAQDISVKPDGWTAGDTTLQGADLEGVDLRHVRGSLAFFANSNLRGADLQGAVLSSSNLEGSDLSNASLEGASLDDVRLGGATLLGAALDSSDVRGADLQGVNFAGASLSGLRSWNDILRVAGANFYGVRNPPDGFLAWAVVNGAMCVESTDIFNAVRAGEIGTPSRPSAVDVNTYCGVSGEQDAVAVAALEITPATHTVRDLGVRVQFEAVARDSANAKIAGRTFAWTSSEPQVAAVDVSGTVVALAAGRAMITATTGGVSSSAELTVIVPLAAGGVPEAVATVEVIQILDTLTAAGDTVRLNAVARGASGAPISGTRFTWRGSDRSVVTVTTAGLATAVGDGSATITARTSRGIVGSTALTVSRVASTVEVVGAIDSIMKDDRASFTAIPRDANGATMPNTTVTWSTTNPAVATVSATGQATGRGRGSATIRATSGTAVGGTPLRVTALEFAEIVAGVSHTCALAVSGFAHCWGANSLGQLGDGSRTDRVLPTRVAGDVRFQSLNSGHQDPAAHTCGPTATGVPYCWGGNSSGRLGSAATTAVPVMVQSGLRVASMSAGFRHTCGVSSSNEAYCWGDNTLGALGNGTQRASNAPVRVSGPLAFRSISAGGFFTCAVTVSGGVYCWGMNRNGQLGIGITDQTGHSTPERVRSGVTFRSVSTAMAHACGVSTTGEVYCWGANRNGELGTGTAAPSISPTAVAGGLSFRMVSVGGHSCGVTTNDEIYCWGANGSGQLGDGAGGAANGFRAAPVRVSGGLQFQSVSVGGEHTCALTIDRIAYCWGSNENAMLGGATTARCGGRPCSRTPIRVRGQG